MIDLNHKHESIYFTIMCGSPDKSGQAIIPLKSKLYYDEKIN
jgi:hypothetical protein